MSGPSRRRLFTVSAFVPIVSMLAIWMYASGFDGWGAWATAPLLLIPPLISAPMVFWGLSRVTGERRREEAGIQTPLLTVIAGLPLLWLLWRLAVTA